MRVISVIRGAASGCARLFGPVAIAAGLFVVGCESEEDAGAPSAGSGSAVISGNVTSVGDGPDSARRASALPVAKSAGNAGVLVSIVGTDISATTDENGNFTLSGAPGGVIEIRFESEYGVGILVMEVQDGSTIELRDVRVMHDRVEVGQVLLVETVPGSAGEGGTVVVPTASAGGAYGEYEDDDHEEEDEEEEDEEEDEEEEDEED